ncbi:MAG: DUF542 domain-containing protein [Gemmatimonadota bacterium]|nr:MAG: DUF542 domain-containing protein [Gemmatimonadota bacterium]
MSATDSERRLEADGDRGTIALDVRPILAAGEEPLELILETAAGVAEGEVLQVTAPFEPVPLYAVLGARGFAHRTEMRGADHFVVRFTQTGITPESTVAEVYERYPAAAPILAEHGFDLCCGGAHTLEFAARAHGLERDDLVRRLQEAALAAD